MGEQLFNVLYFFLNCKHVLPTFYYQREIETLLGEEGGGIFIGTRRTLSFVAFLWIGLKKKGRGEWKTFFFLYYGD